MNPSNTWTNLLSGFVGAIVGGLATLLATWIAMRQERAMAREAAAEDRRQFKDARSQGAARELVTLAIGPLRDGIRGLPYTSDDQHNPLPDLESSMGLSLIPLITDTAIRSRFTSLLAFVAELDTLGSSKLGSSRKYGWGEIYGDCRRNADTYLTYVTRSLRAYLAGEGLPPPEEPSREYPIALERLRSDSVDVRISGISKLGHMADELDDWATVTAILADYVCERAPWPPKLQGQPSPDASVSLSSWAPDVQVALSVIGRRQPTTSIVEVGATYQKTRASYEEFELSGVDLRKADLKNAQFEKLYLSSSENTFRAADMRGIKMRGVTLRGVDLRGADLRGADLREVDFGSEERFISPNPADLRKADLREADLKGANFATVEIKDTNLQNAIASTATVWPQGFKPESFGIRVETE